MVVFPSAYTKNGKCFLSIDRVGFRLVRYNSMGHRFIIVIIVELNINVVSISVWTIFVVELQ